MREMKDGDHGDEEKQLQQKLLDLGYRLPKYGADGWIGTETIRAAMAFATDYMLVDFWASSTFGESSIPPYVVKEILAAPVEKRKRYGENLGVKFPDGFVDTTRDHAPEGSSPHPRGLTDVTAIVLHQTACHLGTRIPRWHSLHAHIGVTREGVVIVVNPFEVKCYHANYFNSYSVGVEIDGNFAGIEDASWSVWKGGGKRSKLPDVQIAGARNACQWICDVVKAGGGGVKHIFAHRQTSPTRRGDPGELIWQSVGIWSQVKLGLRNDPLYTRGRGLPIPKQWDPKSPEKY